MAQKAALPLLDLSCFIGLIPSLRSSVIALNAWTSLSSSGVHTRPFLTKMFWVCGLLPKLTTISTFLRGVDGKTSLPKSTCRFLTIMLVKGELNVSPVPVFCSTSSSHVSLKISFNSLTVAANPFSRKLLFSFFLQLFLFTLFLSFSFGQFFDTFLSGFDSALSFPWFLCCRSSFFCITFSAFFS